MSGNAIQRAPMRPENVNAQSCALANPGPAGAILAALAAAGAAGVTVPTSRTGVTAQHALSPYLPEALRGRSGATDFWQGFDALVLAGDIQTAPYLTKCRHLRRGWVLAGAEGASAADGGGADGGGAVGGGADGEALAVLAALALAHDIDFAAARTLFIDGDAEAGVEQLNADNGDGVEIASVITWLRILADRANGKIP